MEVDKNKYAKKAENFNGKSEINHLKKKIKFDIQLAGNIIEYNYKDLQSLNDISEIVKAFIVNVKDGIKDKALKRTAENYIEEKLESKEAENSVPDDDDDLVVI